MNRTIRAKHRYIHLFGPISASYPGNTEFFWCSRQYRRTISSLMTRFIVHRLQRRDLQSFRVRITWWHRDYYYTILRRTNKSHVSLQLLTRKCKTAENGDGWRRMEYGGTCDGTNPKWRRSRMTSIKTIVDANYSSRVVTAVISRTLSIQLILTAICNVK